MSRAFVGSGEYLLNTNPPVNDSPLTLSCIFYPTAVTASRGLMVIEEGGGDQWYRMYHAGTVVRAYARAGGVTPIADSTTTFSINTWNVATAVFASDTSRSAYLNGGGKGTSGTLCSPDSAQINRIFIAGYSSGFDGRLAEMGVWNVALTDEEVAILGQFVSPLMVRPQNLVFYLPAIRDNDEDLVGGLSLTVGGTPTVSAHPRVFYAIPPSLRRLTTVGGPPDAPTNLNVAVVDSNQIDLTWDDNSSDESGFKIERSLDGSDWAQIDTVEAEAESYEDIGLDPNILYYYRVKAYSGGGDSAPTNVASATTSPHLPTLQQYLVWDGTQIRQTDQRYTALADGVPVPDTIPGITWIYVDEADGDLKVKFGDGTIKTLTIDT